MAYSGGEPGEGGVIKTSGFKNFDEFFPYYMNEHKNLTCRRLHIIGTTISMGALITAIVQQDWRIALGGFVQGYVWAWIGHFVFEKNKPATFKYPVWSFLGDLRMWYGVVTGRYRI